MIYAGPIDALQTESQGSFGPIGQSRVPLIGVTNAWLVIIRSYGTALALDGIINSAILCLLK